MARYHQNSLTLFQEGQTPTDIAGLLAYLNAIPGLALEEGTMRFWNVSVTTFQGEYVVLNGDQAMFAADTPSEVYSFLAGLAQSMIEFRGRAENAFQEPDQE